MLGARVNAADGAGLALLVHATVREPSCWRVVSWLETPPALLLLDGVRGGLLVCAPHGAIPPTVDRLVVWLPAGPIRTADRRAAWAAAAPTCPTGRSPRWPPAPDRPAVTAQLGPRGRRPDPGRGVRADPAVAATTLPPGVELVAPDVPWDALVLPADAAAQLRDSVARLDHAPASSMTGACGGGPTPSTARVCFCRARRAPASRWPPARWPRPPAPTSSRGSVPDRVEMARRDRKNLGSAFDAAERTQTVLMLDEATPTTAP